MFTHGPFGHLTAFVYTGELFPARVIWEFISKALFAAILCATLIRLPALWRPFFLLFVLLFIWADGTSDPLYFLVITCLAVLLLKQGSVNPALVILTGLLLAIFSLIKFTYFLLVIFLLALLVAFYCKERKPARALLLGLVFFVAFLLCWGIAGQQYGNLLSYITTSLDVSLGYKEAMGIPARGSGIILAGLAAAFLGLFQCALILIASREPPVLFIALFLAGETLLSWNRAFIRADDHVLSFFALCPVMLLAMWIVVRPKPIVRNVGYSINLLVFVICLFGIVLQRPSAFVTCFANTVGRLQANWIVATGLPAVTRNLQNRLTEAKSVHSLPRVQAEVRQQSVDVLGFEQGIALLNDLNYTPRPVFQGYSAYTSTLIKANTGFYSSVHAPDYVLFKYHTIDNRYPALDDAGVLKQLLFNYRPLFEERGYSLWKRIQPAKPILPTSALPESLALDSEHALPVSEQPLWLQLDIRPSLQGRVLNLLYKPPIVTIRVTDSFGHRTSHRVIPSMASSGFIITPYLKTPRRVLGLVGGAHNVSVVSFSVRIPREARRFFQKNVVCRLTALPDMPRTELDEQALGMADTATLDRDEALQDRLMETFYASGEVLLNLDSANRLGGLTPLNQSQFSTDGTGLTITATGADPQILLPRFPTGSQGGVLIRIDLEAPVDTGFQVFFLPVGVSAYGGNVINRFLRRGENTVYFALTDSQLAGGQLRVDPGMSSGDYVITKLEVRAASLDSLSGK